jgi:hypothetical protein
MESADVLAGIVACSATARDRRNWNDFSGRNDCSVCAVLENNAVTTLIISVVCFECRCVEVFIQSGIANPASHFLLARSGTNGLLLTPALLIATFTTPVVPPGLVDVTPGSLSASLVITAVCHRYRCGRGDVTRWNRNFWDSHIGSNNRNITSHVVFCLWCAFLLTR